MVVHSVLICCTDKFKQKKIFYLIFSTLFFLSLIIGDIRMNVNRLNDIRLHVTASFYLIGIVAGKNHETLFLAREME